MFIASVAFADEEESANPWEWTGPAGKLSSMTNVFVQPIRGLQTAQQRLDLELEGSVTNQTYTTKFTPWAYARYPDATGAEKRPAKFFFEAKDGWIERTSPLWDLRVGSQVFSWGAADQINPTDVWNPRDLYDPIQSTKLPILAGRLKIHPMELEQVSLELIGAPHSRQARLPVAIPDRTRDLNLSDSRWLLPVPSAFSTDGLSAPLFYKITEATYPSRWEVGGKLSVTRLGGWDFAFYGFAGVEKIPRFAITRAGSAASSTLPITITLHPSFHRMQMYGVDGTGSVSVFESDVGTRFEFAYVHRENGRALEAEPRFQHDLLKDDFIHGVAGIDYTLKKKILGTVLYFNLQYVHYQRLGARESTPGEFVIRGLPNVLPWDDNLVLYWESRINPTLKFAANMVGSFRNRDGLVTPQLHYQWTDNFKSVLSGDFFLGPSDGFFGQFRDNSRGNLLVSYAF